MMYVTTPSGWHWRRTASASMPMPMRSSERNISRASCLVNDTVEIVQRSAISQTTPSLAAKESQPGGNVASGKIAEGMKVGRINVVVDRVWIAVIGHVLNPEANGELALKQHEAALDIRAERKVPRKAP